MMQKCAIADAAGNRIALPFFVDMLIRKNNLRIPPPPPPNHNTRKPWSEINIRSNSFRELKQFIKWTVPERVFDKIWQCKKHFTKESLKKRKSLLFQVPLCDHCNLNCKGCAACSPLAAEWYLDTEVYEKDCGRLSELSGGSAEYIDLLGGEPLLHPEIIKIIEITRKNFTCVVNIITNGLKLATMDGEFWAVCKKNDINIVISGYPIKIDYEKIRLNSAKYSVPVEIRGFAKKLTIWNKFPYDLQGKQNEYNNFLSCLSSNFCIVLKNGKIATCGQVFAARHFNEYFNKNMEIADKNFIDIYKASSLDEILEFVSHPIPFCRYCAVKKIKRGIKWETSKKEITEWA
jgi:MoaA/NifB/PqqE/SkfB family radical SAM enzyme